MEEKEDKQKFIDRISTKLLSLESERKNRILKLIFKQIAVLVIFYLTLKGVLFFCEDHTYISVACGVIAFFSGAIFFCNFSDDDKNFKKFLKQRVKSQIVRNFNLKTIKGKAFTDEFLKKSNLFSVYTYQETDDVIQGCYNEVDYTIAETKLVAKGNKNEFDVFKGVIISFKSNKVITAETLITTKGDNSIRNYPPNSKSVISYLIVCCFFIPMIYIGYAIYAKVKYFNKSGMSITNLMTTHSPLPHIWFLTIWDLVFPVIIILSIALVVYYKKKKMQNVKLEDLTFDRKFNVYTQDQIEARYLLTPAFMERLKSLETSFGTKNIKCSFFEDNIMFAISTNKDLFELGSLYKSLKSKISIEEFYNEIHSIQEMINHLKLDEKLGL